MINNLKLKNFKCFKEVNINFSKLTIFTGTNSTGKSSIIQSLLLLKQNIDACINSNLIKFNLNGHLYNFGVFRDIFNRGADDNIFSISVDGLVYNSIYTSDNSDDRIIHIETKFDFKNIFNEQFIYLSAERYGPKLNYQINSKFSDDIIDLGVYGEHAIYEYFKRRNSPVINQKFVKIICDYFKLEKNNFIDNTDNKSKMHVNFLLKTIISEIYPEFNMNVTEDNSGDIVSNRFFIPNDPTSSSVRPNHIGFGISSVLPILIACCLIEENGTIIVENPEIHLHPKAQSAISKILAMLAESGVQVIIETHSDHFINGVRVYTKNRFISGNDITKNTIINFIADTNCQEINIDEHGYLSAFFEDFYDQEEKDLLELL